MSCDSTCVDAETTELQVSAYVEQLSILLDGVVLSWESWKAFLGAGLEGTIKWANVEHGHRRRIAMLDEEIELHERGVTIAAAAHHLNRTVSSGCWYVNFFSSPSRRNHYALHIQRQQSRI